MQKAKETFKELFMESLFRLTDKISYILIVKPTLGISIMDVKITQ